MNKNKLVQRIMKKRLKNSCMAQVDVDTIWDIGGISWDDHSNEMVMKLLEEELCEIVWGQDPEGVVLAMIEALPKEWYTTGIIKEEDE
jgi:hypothetical protein|tara:strand:+ start:312 stop:575 length:264 start_codon:yes stop_codon:yes gene_type:complete